MSNFIKNLIANKAILNSKTYKELEEKYPSVYGQPSSVCSLYFAATKVLVFEHYGNLNVIAFARTVKHVIK